MLTVTINVTKFKVFFSKRVTIMLTITIIITPTITITTTLQCSFWILLDWSSLPLTNQIVDFVYMILWMEEPWVPFCKLSWIHYHWTMVNIALISLLNKWDCLFTWKLYKSNYLIKKSMIMCNVLDNFYYTTKSFKYIHISLKKFNCHSITFYWI